jgi:hypothetical protein
MQILPQPADVNGHWQIKAASVRTVFQWQPPPQEQQTRNLESIVPNANLSFDFQQFENKASRNSVR